MVESEMELWKYTIHGNDFILVDYHGRSEIDLSEEDLKLMCHQHNGIGADGMSFILDPPPESDAQFKYLMILADGTEDYCCGNLTLAYTAFVVHREYVPPLTKFTFLTRAGVKTAQILQDGRSKVNLGRFYTKAEDIPSTLVPPNQIILQLPLNIQGKEWKINAFSIGKVAPRVCLFLDTFIDFDTLKWGQIIQEHLLALKCFPKVYIYIYIYIGIESSDYCIYSSD